ncbi:MAG: histidine kinase [Pseudomonadota bacterium]|nr:histidine kinase [Pseudomonadota bacterium]MED5248972.1 histidine kinase [Pseudomonadota bacterium]
MTDSQNSSAPPSHPESRRWHYLLPRRFFWWSGGVLGLSVICVVLVMMLGQPRDDHALIQGLLLALTTILLLSLVAMLLGVQRWLLGPLLALRDWASSIRQGDFSSRLPRSDTSEIGELADDINRLSEWLESLAEERERELQAQQQRLHERTQLANELHDSLAQTLASLKFQIRVLDDTLRQDSESAIWQEMERIESSVDEANVELRELIAHFRAPLSRHGLIPGIRRLLSRLRKETGTETVLQNQADDAELTDEEEAQILRIVQEALANVRKHSRANMVRVLLSYDNIGRLRLIVEDDGIGMVIAPDDQNSDGHFGLAIMQERAGTVGAEVTIESEPGDGTRVAIQLGSADKATAKTPLGERTE